MSDPCATAASMGQGDLERVAQQATEWNERPQAKRRGRPLKPDPERQTLLEALRQREPDRKIGKHSILDGVHKVYFVQEGTDGPIKVGHTESVLRKRMDQLQNGNPRRLTILGVIAGDRGVESNVHDAFGHLRVAGTNEWFHPGPDLLEFIQSVAALVPPPLATNTGYRGVHQTKAGSYVARVCVGAGSDKAYAGVHPTAEDAARAYDAKARELKGGGAVLNFPGPGERHWTQGKCRRG